MDVTFSHLHVASHLSAHYGVTSSAALAGLAAADGATFLALTDRDGLYGGPKHVGACMAAGISPGLGADLAFVDEEQRDLGRAVELSCGQNAGAGFGQLCRLVSAAHAKKGAPAVSRGSLEALLVEDPQLVVVLGPESDVGFRSLRGMLLGRGGRWGGGGRWCRRIIWSLRWCVTSPRRGAGVWRRRPACWVSRRLPGCRRC